ncbi:MAG: hypothetical protein K2P70_01575 [Hyphomonadaceae bacterium]|nr:hypothetical protein [Hyphomonadaceae bacterium]
MEALIVAVAALILMVLLEAGYAITLSLVRWTPKLALGLLVVWLAHRHGFDGLEALGLGALAIVVLNRLLRARESYETWP